MPRESTVRDATARLLRAASALGVIGVIAIAPLPRAAAAPTPAGAGAPPAVFKQSTTAAKTIADIRAFEDACNKAYGANDLKAYFDCYWDDMTQLYQQGRLDLPEYRKVWEKEIADGGGMVEVKVADMVIHVGPSNDAAVAAYRIFTKQRHPDGTTTDAWNQETDILFKRSGRWKIVHLHYSDAPKPEAPKAN